MRQSKRCFDGVIQTGCTVCDSELTFTCMRGQISHLHILEERLAPPPQTSFTLFSNVQKSWNLTVLFCVYKYKLNVNIEKIVDAH